MDAGGPILGVKVTIGPYSIITGPNSPAYFELQAGIYNILFEKTGYYSYTLNQMYVGEGQIIEINSIMSEKLLPPQDFTVKPLTPFAQWLPPELNKEVIFNEDFDLHYQLGRWQQDKITNNFEWAISTGSPSGTPDTSHSGSNNVSLFGNPGTARLVSPKILLIDSEKSQVHFWYTLPGANQGDELKILYKTEPSGIWHLLSTFQDSISVWEDTILTIPGNPESCILGFYGSLSENSPGICLDDISVIKSTLSGTFRDRGFRQYKMYQNNILLDSTYSLTYFFTQVDIGETYVVGIQAEYSSEIVTDTFTYYTCDYFNSVYSFEAFVYGESVKLRWWDPADKDLLYRWDRLGYQILRNNVPVHDGLINGELYWDTPWPNGTYNYNIISVYDSGYSCLLDPLTVTTFSEYSPPVFFQNDTIIGDSVLFSWRPPGTPIPEWIHWDDGVNYGNLGLTAGGTWYVAARFDCDDLESYNNMDLIKMAFVPGLNSGNTTFEMMVWEGENAETLLISQPADNLILGEWNTISLESPITIDASRELWIGYKIIDQLPGEYPAGYDDGPEVYMKGAMILFGGNDWQSVYDVSGSGIDINFNIKGYVYNIQKGNRPNLPVEKETIKVSSEPSFVFDLVEPGKGAVFNHSSRNDPIGYQIYKNAVKHAFIPPDDSIYKEHIPFPGTWEYYISAVYENGESSEDGPVIVEIFPGQICGTVLDKKDLDPIYEAEITVWPGPYTTKTDIYGVFNIDQIPAGMYNLNVMAEGYHSDVIIGLTIPQDTAFVSIKLSKENIYMIPFEEEWDSSSFVNQSWLFAPTLGNWSIDHTIGNPVPSARFSGFPGLSNFEYALISPMIDISSAFNNLELSFYLRMKIENTGVVGDINIEVLNEETWISLDKIEIDQMTWRGFSYYLSKHDFPDITQFRFTVSGEESEDFDYILIDNIELKQAESAILQGIVTELASGAPVAEAEILVDPYAPVYTDADGLFVMTVDEGYHHFTVQKTGFNPYIIDSLFVEEFVYLNIELTQPVFSVDPEEVWQLTAWWSSSRIVTLSNDGNGPLFWQSSLSYLDEDQESIKLLSFDQRMEWNLGFVYDVTTSSGGILNQAGIEFDGTYFYTTVWDSDEILKFDREGIHIGTYNISGACCIRDLAFDGEYLYGGAGSTTIYQIDPETFDVINQFGSPEGVRGIAYYEKYDAFWVCNWTTDFWLVSRDGSTLDIITNPGIENVYGLAYDYLSQTLWVFNQGLGGADFVGINIVSGQLTGDVHNILEDIQVQGDPFAGGAFLGIDEITGLHYLGGLVQADYNLIFGYDLGQEGWLFYFPTEGTILPNESIDLTLYFDAIDTLNIWEYVFADITFIHEPIIDTFILHVFYTMGENIEETGLDNIIKVYPNPTQDHLIIESKSEIKSIMIYDYSGKLVSNQNDINQNTIPINTQTYPPGLYVLEVVLKDGIRASKKIIVYK